MERAEWGSAYEDQGLVFARENGTPIRPEHVVKRFGPLCRAAGVPKITIHDLRHTAATLMIGSGVPLAVVSKVLRHTQVSITADLYGHLTPEIATSATDTFGAALRPPALSTPQSGRCTLRPQCAQKILKTTLRAPRYRKPRSSDMARPKRLELPTF